MCEYEQRWSLPTAEEIKAEVDWLADWLAREEPSMIGIDSRAAREFITAARPPGRSTSLRGRP